MIDLLEAAFLQNRLSSNLPREAHTTIHTDNMLVEIIRRNYEQVILIKGTDSFADWWNINRKIGMQSHVAFPGKVHGGFKDAVYEIGYLVRQNIDRQIPVSVVGHSMGGAVAELLGWLLNERGYMVYTVITFGQPRVGDWTFALKYNEKLGERTYRLINDKDVVPCVPWVLGRYRHTKQPMYLKNGVRWKRPVFRAFRSIASVVPKLFKLDKSDHAMSEYAKVAGDNAYPLSLYPRLQHDGADGVSGLHLRG